MSYRDMYFETVKVVLDRCVPSYAESNDLSTTEVDSEISDHIASTSAEHHNPDPDIDYCDPLCRLGYVFTHVGANATLFERTIEQSESLSQFVDSRAGHSLSLCTAGGGPGTELLGLTKYCLTHDSVPSEITFAVLDSVYQWGETWELLAQACRDRLAEAAGEFPPISRGFYTMDVVDPQSYDSFAWLLEGVDIVVFNYLVSENQVRLDEFEAALEAMVDQARLGSFFVVIDRYERRTSFRQDVTRVFEDSDLSVTDELTIGGVMTERESALGDYPTRFNWRPRRWFRTRVLHRPTVFIIVAEKPEETIPF